MAKSSASSKKKSQPSKARVLSSRTVYRGPVFWVTTDQVEEPGGEVADDGVERESSEVATELRFQGAVRTVALTVAAELIKRGHSKRAAQQAAAHAALQQLDVKEGYEEPLDEESDDSD